MAMNFYPLCCENPVAREALEKFPRLQLIDAMAIAGEEHISFAIAQAERAFSTGSNIASEPHLEVLVRASARSQIGEAIEKLGVRGSREVVVISEHRPEDFLSEYGCRSCSEVLELSGEKLDYLVELFGIGRRELEVAGGEGEEVVKSIIRERIALLNL